jgi:excinuclease ABC subunit C
LSHRRTRAKINLEALSMTDLVSEKLARLPASPGVYVMKDAQGKVIYVGKALVLKSRVRSYFQSSRGTPWKTQSLVSEIADLDVIQTATEAEAFLLEDTLIKRHRPPFNIRLRDDKRYPYLKISGEPFPRVTIVRRRHADGARYFGPYTNAKAMRSTLKLAQKLFPIRTCTLALPLAKPRRPCLNYHIGRCLGPCGGLVNEEAYAEAVEGAAMLFEGRISGLVSRLKRRMSEVARAERYEEAAVLRDQLRALVRASERQSVALADEVDLDAIAVAMEGDAACAEVFLVRAGRLSGRETFHLRAPGNPSEEDVLAAFLSQYYAEASTIPEEVLLSRAIAEEEGLARWLASLRQKKVGIKVPKRGEKRHLVKMAQENAGYALRGEQMASSRGAEAAASLASLEEALALSAFPRRIEAFDISNTQGGEATGSMVVFVDGRPRRDAYRRFKVRISGKPNDYAMMAEVLRRRFRRGLAEMTDPSVARGKFSEFPDLLLVDGGKGQLSVAVSVLDELGIEGVEAIGLAKRLEEVFRVGTPEPLSLPSRSKALLLLRQIRDEAHRFAITYHRRLRSQRSLASSLDLVPGIGPKRRQALVKAFGSLERLARASSDEIARVPGISRDLAETVARHLAATAH